MITDNNHNKKHIGTEIRFAKHLSALSEVELYFIESCDKLGVEHSYDCTAFEKPYYKTLNYTTFAGMFICHPLQFEMSFFQVYDAITDDASPRGHVDFVRRKHLQGKYEGSFISYNNTAAFNLVVLPGGNKFNTVNWDKLKRIASEDPSLLLKPHPVTKPEELDIIQRRVPRAKMAPRMSSLYDLLSKADKVYTTHISETALTSLVLGKEIEPIDKYPECYAGAFSHLTHLLFTNEKPLELIEKVFSSEKSGIIHPDVDTDWKRKIDAYLEYTLNKRQMHKGYM